VKKKILGGLITNFSAAAEVFGHYGFATLKLASLAKAEKEGITKTQAYVDRKN
jgi:hypothetical protein